MDFFARLRQAPAWRKVAQAWQAPLRFRQPLLAALRPPLNWIRAKAAPARRFLSTPRTRRWLKVGGLAGLAAVLLLGLAFFAFRNALLRGVLDSKLRSYAKGSPGTIIEVGAAKFRGLAGVELQQVRYRSPEINVALGSCAATASFWKLVIGRVQLKSLSLHDLGIDLNMKALPALPLAGKATGRAQEKGTGRKTAPGEQTIARGGATDYGARVNRLLHVYFTRIPDRLLIERLTIHTAFDDVRQALFIPRLAIGGSSFATSADVFDQGRKWSCALAGGVDRGNKRLDLRLTPARRSAENPQQGGAANPRPGNGTSPAPMPFLERQWGLKAGFDSLTIGLQSRGRRDGVLALDGRLSVTGLQLNHARIAAADVDLDNAALDFTLRVGADFVELAPPSRVSFNRMAFQPLVRFVARPTRQVLLHIPETRFAADDLFASLPAGLFTRLAGIRTAGALSFHLDFAIDISRPEAVVLDVGLQQHGFRILRFGNANLRHFAGPFLYTAYEKDRPVRSFVVGPENPSFRFLESIPAILQNSVMISEDGAFFSHRGFLLEPFKNSIVVNLRAGRFVRGASTISMQLVKNLYLRRHKTMARKLEELLITWLIEENRLVSKGRMLETYLNVIEWGPGVYGAQEAARYYFDKDVEQLTLAEAIFMAAIVPRPKRFMGFFGDDQRLRPWLQRYYADVSRKMLARGWITQFDFDTLLPEVTLAGPARLLLKGAETEAVTAEEILVDGPL